MKKTNFLYFKVIIILVLIGCSEINNKKTITTNEPLTNSSDTILFKGTELQLVRKKENCFKINDVSKYISQKNIKTIKLNDFQIEKWIEVFPNIGGHEFRILSILEEEYIFSLYILAIVDGGNLVYIITVSKEGEFMDVLNVFSTYREGPRELNDQGIVLQFELKNSILHNDTIQLIRTQTLTKNWESTEMYEEVLIENYFIKSDGKIKSLD